MSTRIRKRLLDLVPGVESLKFFEPEEVFDRCIIGVGVRAGESPRVVYDLDKLIPRLQEVEKWTTEEVTEWLETNTLSAWVGPDTPTFVSRLSRSVAARSQKSSANISSSSVSRKRRGRSSVSTGAGR